MGNLINYLSDFLASCFWIPQLLIAPAFGIASDLPAPGPGFNPGDPPGHPYFFYNCRALSRLGVSGGTGGAYCAVS